jgi:hypothetical protein
MYIQLYQMFIAIRPIYYELLALPFERDTRVWRFTGILTDGYMEGFRILP